MGILVVWCICRHYHTYRQFTKAADGQKPVVLFIILTTENVADTRMLPNLAQTHERLWAAVVHCPTVSDMLNDYKISDRAYIIYINFKHVSCGTLVESSLLFTFLPCNQSNLGQIFERYSVGIMQIAIHHLQNFWGY